MACSCGEPTCDGSRFMIHQGTNGMVYFHAIGCRKLHRLDAFLHLLITKSSTKPITLACNDCLETFFGTYDYALASVLSHECSKLSHDPGAWSFYRPCQVCLTHIPSPNPSKTTCTTKCRKAKSRGVTLKKKKCDSVEMSHSEKKSVTTSGQFTDLSRRLKVDIDGGA